MEHKYYTIDGKTWEFTLYEENGEVDQCIYEAHSKEQIQAVIDMLIKAIQ